MSLEDYRLSAKLHSQVDDDNYYALIMAAMRGADTNNLLMLKAAFPHIWAELQTRYNAPGGYLEGEQP